MFSISNIKVNEKIKIIYTEEELKLLLKRTPSKIFGGYRTWVILNTLL